MNLAEQLYQTVKPLPEQMVREVLDFALFLKQREKSLEQQNLMLAQAKSVSDWNNAEDESWTNAEFAEMAMTQAMRGMEDEPVLYSLDDLKERWQ